MGYGRRDAAGAGMKGWGKTGDPQENVQTNGIVRHDSHLRKSTGRGLNRIALVEGKHANHSTTMAPISVKLLPEMLKRGPFTVGMDEVCVPALTSWSVSITFRNRRFCELVPLHSFSLSTP
ncbi:hypothetical protein PR048_021083 [Dryococelus australis]|uniref:Transposase n=1 Tax=Dryococelus australis TaxID=614101 RepID=A0ABQ9GXA7_9NEOP|nr:hypothetical protein PR048_021083 [Dryococelus australis]